MSVEDLVLRGRSYQPEDAVHAIRDGLVLLSVSILQCAIKEARRKYTNVHDPLRFFTVISPGAAILLRYRQITKVGIRSFLYRLKRFFFIPKVLYCLGVLYLVPGELTTVLGKCLNHMRETHVAGEFACDAGTKVLPWPYPCPLRPQSGVKK
jgi:hypothetical protein